MTVSVGGSGFLILNQESAKLWFAFSLLSASVSLWLTSSGLNTKTGLTTEAQRHWENRKKKFFGFKTGDNFQGFRDSWQVMMVSVGGFEFLILNQESAKLWFAFSLLRASVSLWLTSSELNPLPSNDENPRIACFTRTESVRLAWIMNRNSSEPGRQGTNPLSFAGNDSRFDDDTIK